MEPRLPELPCPSLGDKDLLGLTLSLSSLVYADHYFSRSLHLFTEKLVQIGVISPETQTELITAIKVESIERRRSTTLNSFFVPLDRLKGVQIGFFYKSRAYSWRQWIGRCEKPSGVILRIWDEVIIAFRGTTKYNIKSSLNNLNLRHCRISGGYSAHRGFVRKLHQASNGYAYTLHTILQDSNCTISFTGHSNGGAQAMIAALEMSLDKKSPPARIRRVITWGGVSCLYGGTVATYDSILGPRTLQTVNEKDSLAKLMDILGVIRVQGLMFVRSSEDSVNTDPHDRINSYLPILESLVRLDDNAFASVCLRAVQERNFVLQISPKTSAPTIENC